MWNIRGLGKGEKIATIRGLVLENKISFMGLVETKHRRPIRSRVRRIWGNDNFDVCEVFANDNLAGGIVTVWDPEYFVVNSKFVGDRWIILDGCIKHFMFECCVGVVYGPNDRVGRSLFFDEIKNVVLPINKPMLFLGDFNTILDPIERWAHSDAT